MKDGRLGAACGLHAFLLLMFLLNVELLVKFE